LFLLAAIISPIAVILNGVDSFYLGLDFNSAFQFILSLIFTSFTSLTISLSRLNLIKKCSLVIIVLIVLVALSGTLNSTQCVIKSPLTQACQVSQDSISFLLGGWTLGNLIGIGTGKWIKQLMRESRSKILFATIPVATMLIVLIANIIGLFQVNNIFFSVLSVIGFITPIVICKILTFIESRERR
jgi:hypothetical protein